MSPPRQEIALVVPCYNEASRINLAEFKRFAQQEGRYCLFVDDGSTDETAELLEGFVDNEKSYFHKLPQNSGKAEAVRQGMIVAKKQLPQCDWIGFWDADLATPLREVEAMMAYNNDYYQGQAKALLGSRVQRLGSRIERSIARHYISRVVVTLISVILKIRAYDSQCGSKLFHKDYLEAFEAPFVTRWLFDVELLIRLKQDKVVEYPLSQWIDQADSKIKMRDGVLVFWDIFKIWRRYR